MISGVRRSGLAAFLAIGLCAGGWAQGSGFGLDNVMKDLAAHPVGRARFTETKRLAVLDQAIVSQGELRFSPPDRLEKHTSSPVRESFVLQGGLASMERGGQKREVRLAEFPELMGMVEALRGVLVGDRALLDKHYSLQFDGSPKGWRIVLTPREERARRWVRQIVVSGVGHAVQGIETQLADGDTAYLDIKPLP